MIYRFHGCELNTDRMLLTREGEIQHVEPQVFEVLMHLIAERDRVVSRHELLEQVWGHEHVSESTLSSCIKMVRKAVGDSGRTQSVIRTVHGKGYEFIAAIADPDQEETGTIASPPAGSSPLDSNLPAAMKTLIGRQEIIQQIRVDLHTSRLVTLIGSGGVGKTSLAYEIARRVGQLYVDGVVAVQLVRINDPESMIGALATALRVHTRQDDNLQHALIDFLQPRDMLLLLDNCEHLVESVGELASRILHSAVGVTLLTTSREPLAIPGEKLWPVEPLDFSYEGGELGSAEGMEALMQVPAIRLFVERAQAVDPGFVFDHSSAEEICEICRRLDGLPLAIELAASRVRTIGVSQIAARIDQRFKLLKGSRRGADARHQTLRDTVRWSFDLLDLKEQTLFSELSVFAGWFDLDAIEAICGEESDEELIDLISKLVERSMVTVRQSVRPLLFYELLDTMRAFGREQLTDKQTTDLADRHASYFARVAQQIQAKLATPEESNVIRTTNATFADQRAAHLHNIATGDIEQAMTSVCAIREYGMRSMRYEVLSWADAALELDQAELHELYPTVLGIQAYAAWVRGDFEQALSLANQVHDLETSRGLVPSGLAERVLANVLYVLGDTEAGFEQTARQLELAEDSGDLSRLTHACYMHSIAQSSMGDPSYALTLAKRASDYGKKSGCPTDIASGYAAMGFNLHDDPDAALRAFSNADEIANQAGNRWMRTFVRTEVCRLLLERGDLDHARKSLSKVIDVWFRAGEWAQQWLTLTGCVVALYRLGHFELTAQSIGAIEARATLGALPVTASLREDAFDVVDALRKKQGEEQFNQLKAEGAELLVSEIVQRNRSALLG